MIESWLIWLVPFLIIPISWLFARFLPFRKIRYSVYAAFLVGAFFLNLFGLSFQNSAHNRIFLLAINLVFSEFFWNLTRISKKKRFFQTVAVLAVCGLCIGSFEFPRWIKGTPAHAGELWNDQVASTYQTKDSVVYTISERNLFRRSKPARLLILAKQVRGWPFEKKIKTYETEEGFFGTPFRYSWSTTSQGARLDLYAPGLDQQIWTMGEGF